jgi:hypothetical protein
VKLDHNEKSTRVACTSILNSFSLLQIFSFLSCHPFYYLFAITEQIYWIFNIQTIHAWLKICRIIFLKKKKTQKTTRIYLIKKHRRQKEATTSQKFIHFFVNSLCEWEIKLFKSIVLALAPFHAHIFCLTTSYKKKESVRSVYLCKSVI